MNRTITILTVALLAAAPMAEAKDKGNGQGKPAHAGKTVPGNAAAGNCPPGLAKKNPPCVPPGLAKRDVARDDDHADDDDRIVYVPGDIITREYIIVQDPLYYGLDPDWDYYRVGDRFYRVDEDTREVIAFVGALADLLD